jgi:hypothetical protein
VREGRKTSGQFVYRLRGFVGQSGEGIIDGSTTLSR